MHRFGVPTPSWRATSPLVAAPAAQADTSATNCLGRATRSVLTEYPGQMAAFCSKIDSWQAISYVFHPIVCKLLMQVDYRHTYATLWAAVTAAGLPAARLH